MLACSACWRRHDRSVTWSRKRLSRVLDSSSSFCVRLRPMSPLLRTLFSRSISSRLSRCARFTASRTALSFSASSSFSRFFCSPTRRSASSRSRRIAATLSATSRLLMCWASIASAASSRSPAGSVSSAESFAMPRRSSGLPSGSSRAACIMRCAVRSFIPACSITQLVHSPCGTTFSFFARLSQRPISTRLPAALSRQRSMFASIIARVRTMSTAFLLSLMRILLIMRCLRMAC